MERIAEIKRKTNETDIYIKLILDNLQKSSINSGIPFFDHMLESMSKHGHFYLELTCKGDTLIDDHHSIEDIGICLGKAFKKAIGTAAGIFRFGDSAVPMDESLAKAVVDISGRPFYLYSGQELNGYIGKYAEELTDEFLHAFAVNAEINLHVSVVYGNNRHHIHEAIFKALGISLYIAINIDPKRKDDIPSTKGSLFDRDND